MNNLEPIDTTFKYLQDIHEITKRGFTKISYLNLSKFRGLALNSLIKNNLLSQEKDTYFWNGVVPNYQVAYDYHNKIRGSKKRFFEVMKTLDKPENFSPDQIMYALSVKAASGIDTETISEKEIQTSTPIENIQIIPENVNGVDNDNLINILEKIEKMSDENVIIRELLNDIKLNIEINNEYVNDCLDSTKKTQESISTLIIIDKINQENLFDLTSSQYGLIKEIYLELKDTADNSHDMKLKKRLDDLGVIVHGMRKRLDSNIFLVNKHTRD